MSSNEHEVNQSENKDDSTNNDLDDKALLEEYQKTTLKGAGKSKKKDWVPDEQYRLLYVYFKDMSLEPLLTEKAGCRSRGLHKGIYKSCKFIKGKIC